MTAGLDDFPLPPFTGFRPEALAFLRDLAAHMDRAWMAANKHVYEAELRAPMESLVAELSGVFAAARLPLRADPKRAIFRLNRDVRFSNDKRPYKTHLGAAMTRNGDKQAPGVLYIHVDPEGSFVAAGFYHPEPPALGRMRAGMVARHGAWTKLVRGLEADGLALGRDDTLIRPPKGFDAAPPGLAEDLKLKSWIVRRDIAPARLGKAALLDDIGAFARETSELLRFGWTALEG